MKLNLLGSEMNFREKLAITSQKNNSLLCVGLDPYQKMITTEDELFSLNRLIVEATGDLACAYKPNLAIYEGMGKEGLSALEQTLEFIRETNPDTPIIGDGKRGDIGNCSLAYTRMLFEKYEFDAVTANPYMGYDSIEPFTQYKDKGIFILCRTSNPGGQDIQELIVMQKGKASARPLYEVVAELALEWNQNNNVGLVVGATYPKQIAHIRQICPNMLFLIPGVGFQGGDIQKTVQCAADAQGGGFIINVSRQIMNVAKTSADKLRKPTEAKKDMHFVARCVRDEINACLPTLPKESQQVCDGNRNKAKQLVFPQEETTPMATKSGR